MTAQHTPGPWVVKPNGEKGLTIFGADHSPVCSSLDYAELVARRVPNFYLIASAPDLLEALSDVLALIVNGQTGCDDDPARIIAAARAAIAKATAPPSPPTP